MSAVIISILHWCIERVSHLLKVTQPVAVGPAVDSCCGLINTVLCSEIWEEEEIALGSGSRNETSKVRCVKTSGTDPSENVWDNLALGIHSSGHNMGGELEEEYGLCGLAERKVASFVCTGPFSNYKFKTSMATRPCLCLLPRFAWRQAVNRSLLPSWDREPSDAETQLSKLDHFPKRYSPFCWWRKHHKFNPLALVQPMAHRSQEVDTTEHVHTHLFLGRFNFHQAKRADRSKENPEGGRPVTGPSA